MNSLEEYLKMYPEAVVYDGLNKGTVETVKQYDKFMNSIHPGHNPSPVFNNLCVMYEVKRTLDSSPYVNFKRYSNLYEALRLNYNGDIRISLSSGYLRVSFPYRYGQWRYFYLHLLDEEGKKANIYDIEEFLQNEDHIDPFILPIVGNPFK